MRRALQLLAFALAIVMLPATANAQERRIESAAREAIKKAQADFRASDFDSAVVRLQKALRTCGTVRCSTTMRAALERDLGVMQFKRGDLKGAEASFSEAIRLDSNLEMSSAYDSEDVLTEWAAARDQGAVRGSREPAGDFTHTPVPEQLVRTPIPVYVEYQGSTKPASVLVKYRTPGEKDYKRITLQKMGEGWGGYIPCGDVKHGVVRYYVQGFDASDSPFALSGDPKRPFYVPVRYATTTPAPSLPGAEPPTQCTPEAAAANEPVQGPIEHAEAAEAEATTTADYARLWIGVSGSVDIQFLPSASDACALTNAALPFNSSGYYCTNPDGSDFPSRIDPNENGTLSPGTAGNPGGGPAWGVIRVLASIDYAISSKTLLGARVGFVANGYKGDAAKNDGRAFGPPIHFELRGTYLFGENPLGRSGFAPLAMIGAGAAQFGAATDVQLTQTGIPGQRIKQAWKPGGPWFGAIGGGFRYAFSQRAGFTALMKLSTAFGGNGMIPTLAPEVGLQYGF